MARAAVIAGVEFGFPFVEQEKRSLSVAGFVSEVVGDAAVGINVVEMLAQALGKKPGGDGEIFVMRAGEAFAVGVGVRLRGSLRGDGVFRGKKCDQI